MCPESKNSNRKILEPQSLIHVDFHFELFLHFFLFLKATPELLHLDIFKLLLVEVLFQHLSVILYYRNHILFHVLWLEAANYTLSPGRVRCSALQSQSHMLTFLVLTKSLKFELVKRLAAFFLYPLLHRVLIYDVIWWHRCHLRWICQLSRTWETREHSRW